MRSTFQILTNKPDSPITWREYHEATKHTVERLRRTRGTLDWANMPDPFRHYEGTPVLDLPADPPPVESGTPSDGTAFLSQLLFYSAAISASKVAPDGDRYALRVNPSSGNLHPTEFHFITRGLAGWPDGLYHYRPSSHMAEQRGLGLFEIEPDDSAAPVVFVLTSISWREAWKYNDRAYRYCLHDIGHAWQALALAAEAMGCHTFAQGQFEDDQLSSLLRLNGDEWPMLIVGVSGSAVPARPVDAPEQVWYGGQANRLSRDEIEYPLIRAIHQATKIADNVSPVDPPAVGSGEIKLPSPAPVSRGFGEVARARRSALDFVGGAQSITFAQLSAILAAATRPLATDFAGTIFIHLYLYVHRAKGLPPGVYRYWAGRDELQLIKAGDQRVVAAGLSLGQDLAGNACVAFSMIADLERAEAAHGDRGYRYAHFAAGAIGQRLYLAAEALGLGATGIGAFFDDRVHEYLQVTQREGQVIYHFAIGYPVLDPRVSAW